MTKDLAKIVEGVHNAYRKINLYKKEYTDQGSELLPGGFVSPIQLKDKQIWLKELEAKLSLRRKGIISSEDASIFIKTIKEIEKIKSHYGFLNSEVKKMRNSWKRLAKTKEKVINFSWPTNEVYQEWTSKYAVLDVEQLEDVATEQQVEEAADVEKDL